jgi:hypothetical protein
VKEHQFSFVGIDGQAEPAQPGEKKRSRSSELLRYCGEGRSRGIYTTVINIEGQVFRGP